MRVLFICMLICSPILLFSQQGGRTTDKQAQKYYEQANRHLSAADYSKAIEELTNAVKADPRFPAALQQLGDIYRKLKNYKEAITFYRKVIAIDPNFHSLTYFGIAESELNSGDYSSALQHFTKYLSFPGLSDNSRKLTARYIADCHFSIEAIKKPVEFKPVNLGPAVNTTSQEYLPVVTADEERIIFTRRVNNNEDFFQSIKTNSSWAPATYLSSAINTANFNEGAQCISPDGVYLFFTGCNRPEGLGRCDIYVCKREGNDWSEPFNIGAPVNTAGWESQPSLSANGRTLYFVSNRPGGLGGYDIWSTELLEGGKWANPVNLGPSINTPYDEHSPFIHPDNSTLYFSSNGWPGLGNRDLYFSRKNSDGQWQKPHNLGFPINTAGEESGLTVSADGRTAFFASNMKGGYGGMDIYSFELPPDDRPQPVTYVKGKVVDSETTESLNAEIKITELKSSAVIFQEESDQVNGEFLATMPEGKIFGLTVYKDGYLFHSENFTLDKAASASKPFSLLIALQKIRTNGIVVLKNIFFETNKAELLPESLIELSQLLSFLRSHPNTVIEITGHTDNTGNDAANQTLSESRARSVYNYLVSHGIAPLRLSYKGSGKTRPIADNSTEEGRRINRRTEFRIVKY
ncbi:WD40 repeat protein [Arcticibacter tournemirensis]|uniref:OmpA family protein n=1 Tax=Arcticibacter tournemirensis TaxID=699437 RepID=A0A5M9GN75_9SPHI|nr:OmpA family protein [Arcticibacter tournemirensis]KAA8474254.1 OmpA family protein [Arcticibacter tournemirensis]TQM51224.1 WD40 repeat protein [Arcticibacter tournemirensis]